MSRGLCLLISVICAFSACSQTPVDLYDFGGTSDDGQSPNGLTQGTNGNFFGTTRNGGTNGYGSIFQLTLSGVETPLYSFKNGADGGSPGAGLTQGTNGLFYGVAEAGGSNGFGSVFQISTNGTLAVLHGFALPKSTKTGHLTNADGYTPSAALTLGTNGNFYGSAAQGGTNSYGTIFEMTHQGKVTVLYSFSNAVDGGTPKAALLQFINGSLYGTTTTGGSNGYGTAFQLTAAGKFTPLYSFTGGDDGAIPEAALINGHDGSLYGTCTAGGSGQSGTIFKISTNGAVTPIYSFTPTSSDAPYYNNDGADPKTLLLGLDGNLYGAAYEGGTNGAGAIFEFSESAGLAPLYSFTYLNYNGAGYANSDGGSPSGLLEAPDGTFYATGFEGGTNAGGVFFRMGFPPQITGQPTNELVSLHSNTSFSITATGALAYQWQLDGANISYATNATLGITNILLANAGYYQVIVTNINGATTSSVVTLSITNAPISFMAGGGGFSYAAGQASLELTNLAGQGALVIDASADLVHWTPIVTNPPAFGSFQFIDTAAGAFTNRFYRAHIQ
ncbi:MAG TPA: choice-of-anchor tandem repeat GloVer-containing protein [Verrucomicrobiae bacterium]|nr:choice-of-anchor tandem repeat GloVer-containing protein [Verrucomicrobiae bacterium]